MPRFYDRQSNKHDQRLQRLWRDALEEARPKPNKYARALRGILFCVGSLCLIFTAVMVGLGLTFGFDKVTRELVVPEFVYGTVLRGGLLLVAVLFASYLLAEWVED